MFTSEASLGDAASTGRLRVGLIGCGNVALSDHVPIYMSMPERFELVALADPTEERRELGRRAAGLSPGDAYADGTDLIARDDLDVIDLCTPPHLRRPLAVAAVEAGLHVLSEKPLATVPADARAMVDAARAAGVRLGVVHNYLFFPEVLRCLELLAAHEIGVPEVALLDWLGCKDFPGASAYRPRWRHDPRSAGGGVLMDMLHIVYLAEALLGRPIERVSGWVHARDAHASVEAIAMARFEADGSAALVNIGWGDGPGGFAVSGPEGRIEVSYVDGGSGAFVPFDRLVVHGRSGRVEQRTMPPDASMRSVILDFADAVRDGREPIATGAQGLHILEASLAVYLSAATGVTVALPLDPEHPVAVAGVAGLARIESPAWSPVRRLGLYGSEAAEG
jgi:predicted dehydrogenase